MKKLKKVNQRKFQGKFQGKPNHVFSTSEQIYMDFEFPCGRSSLKRGRTEKGDIDEQSPCFKKFRLETLRLQSSLLAEWVEDCSFLPSQSEG